MLEKERALQDFWSLGPLGSAWWVILITTGVGIGLVLILAVWIDLAIRGRSSR